MWLLLLCSPVGHASAQVSQPEPSDFTLSKEEKSWLAEHQEVRVGVMDSWPPFNFIDKYGEPAGIGADYVAALNKRLKGVLKLVPGAWEDIYADVKDRKLDALLDITRNPEREEYFNFTTPYLNVPHVIVAGKDAPYLGNEDALIGKTLALERGFGNIEYFKFNYPWVDIREYRDTRFALDAVSRGEADAYAGNRSVALYLIGQELIPNLKVHGRLQKSGSILSIGTRKDWPVLAQILDRALADLKQDEIRQIQSRWIGKENTSRPVKLTHNEQVWLSQHPSIRIAFDKDYPPYSFQNERGEFVGIAVDIANELAAKVGLTLDVYPNGQWKNLYEAAQQRNVDVIATLVKRPGRERSFEFTRPYISLSQYVSMLWKGHITMKRVSPPGSTRTY